jgi:hypothetical protein
LFTLAISLISILLTIIVIISWILYEAESFGLHYKENSKKFKLLKILQSLGVIFLVLPLYALFFFIAYQEKDIKGFIVLSIPFFICLLVFFMILKNKYSRQPHQTTINFK